MRGGGQEKQRIFYSCNISQGYPSYFWHSNVDICVYWIYDMYFITDCVANSISERNLASMRTIATSNLSLLAKTEKMFWWWASGLTVLAWLHHSCIASLMF